MLEPLETLQEKVKHCTKCNLCKTRKNAILGSGSSNSSILFVGESPGATEDQHDRPFIGRSGQFLRQMIRSVGIPENKFYMTNVIKCRPPEGREALPDEVDACWEHTIALLRVIKPKILVPLGRTPLFELAARLGFKKNIKGRKITQTAGQIIYHAERGFYVLPMYQPAYCLRRGDIRIDFESHLFILAKGYEQWEQRKT